ncbi:MAG: hypothetical protein BAJALOKI2v1_620010 [Promethearchaeota archaeon]|nr:MAG: hypothetical protein BAJALOKI2v1_620010 [Candidatus Lokiarchaeota archaeon]
MISKRGLNTPKHCWEEKIKLKDKEKKAKISKCLLLSTFIKFAIGPFISVFGGFPSINNPGRVL